MYFKTAALLFIININLVSAKIGWQLTQGPCSIKCKFRIDVKVTFFAYFEWVVQALQGLFKQHKTHTLLCVLQGTGFSFDSLQKEVRYKQWGERKEMKLASKDT